MFGALSSTKLENLMGSLSLSSEVVGIFSRMICAKCCLGPSFVAN